MSGFGERAYGTILQQSHWIPAFAGMTEEGVPGCAVRTFIPAFAGMTVGGLRAYVVRTIVPAFAGMTSVAAAGTMSMTSFPLARE